MVTPASQLGHFILKELLPAAMRNTPRLEEAVRTSVAKK
jgi:hypothetical protein